MGGRKARSDDDSGISAEKGMKLYHGTCTTFIPSIFERGLVSPVYLTDEIGIAKYFADEACSVSENTAQGTGKPIIIELEITPEIERHLKPDYLMLAQPIWPWIEIEADELTDMLAEKGTGDTYRTTLETVHSVVYKNKKPINITKEMLREIEVEDSLRNPKLAFQGMNVRMYRRRKK